MGVCSTCDPVCLSKVKSVAVQGLEVKTVLTKPIEGQKTGTSGLRKKTNVFTGENYLANWSAAWTFCDIILQDGRRSPIG